MCATAFWAALLAATMRLHAGPDAAQAENSSGSRVVSPAVVASWISRTEASGSSKLELLVLWRGSTGWFLREGSSGSSTSAGGSSTVAPDGKFDTVTLHESAGGLGLDLTFDPRKRVAQIQGHEVDLRGADVVLVDEVDGSEGPRVVRTLQVDPTLSGSPAPAVVEEIVRRSQDLFSYLRCAAKLTDPNVQPMMDALCERMKQNP